MQSFEKWVREIRREFHRNPELSFHEYGTQARIMSILEEIGIDCRKIADTGVIAEVRGMSSGPCIAIRSDTDALAAHEVLSPGNEDYISQNPGVMHACGHDGHMAIVLGVVRLVKEKRKEICGTVRFIFQPAEEVPPGGAIRVIEEGGLDDVDAIIGLHIFSDVDIGQINVRAGPLMASSNRFTVKIFGKGGHHARPDLCIDPIQIAAEFISSLKPAVSQKVDASDHVLGFGAVNSGKQFNRSPDDLELVGSFRTFDDNDIDTIECIMSDLLDSLMHSYSKDGQEGVPSYDLNVYRGYPVLFNDPSFTERASSLLKTMFENVNTHAGPIFGAEDFAYYLREVPGMYTIIGTKNVEKGIVEVNHSSSFDIDEDVLITGVELLYSLATDFLRNSGEYLK
ncbi:amidohydrolase [Methanolobus sediminis]|uniref:Amidohydrolase n=1 Tax=Methanolobus sediminis TaxID=3072978 RepID=A0AA51YMY7_9EURY|nr:amidohydrolase [Methanolobus sediminis]WMW26083.1 amidohydrolase [Methanolobus sediminis]